MTAQRFENLELDGEAHGLASVPLESLFAQRKNRPPFAPPNTALWRGYVGSWAIREGHLYLDRIEGRLKNSAPVTIGFLFPDQKAPILAEWYTGQLRVPTGRMLSYKHAGFASTFEGNIVINVQNGRVVQLKTNNKSILSLTQRLKAWIFRGE